MRIKSVILISILLLFMALNITSVAFADVDKQATVDSYIQTNCAVANGEVKCPNNIKPYIITKQPDANIDQYTAVNINTNNLTVSVYYAKSNLDALYSVVSKQLESQKVTQKIGDITNNLSIQADTASASTMLSGLKPIIELVIGIIVVFIAFGMTIFSSFDIAYIAFPVFRNKMEDAVQSSNSFMTKKTSNGNTTLRWITDDAQYAVTQGSLESGKNPWALYFQKRILSYVFLGITLFILLTGNITIITDIAVKVVSGIMNVLADLAK